MFIAIWNLFRKYSTYRHRLSFTQQIGCFVIMAMKCFLRVIRLLAVLSLCYQGAECCNLAAIDNCMTYSFTQVDNGNKCNDFNNCLKRAAFASCTVSSSEMRSSVSPVTVAQLNATLCEETIKTAQNIPITKELICFCERKRELMLKCEKELDNLDTDCPRGITDFQLERNVTLDDLCNDVMSYPGRNCECATLVDECVNEHLGQDFRSNYEPLIAENYPECLKLGNEEEFESAANCLFSLPSECGLRDLTGFYKVNQPYGNDILKLRYSCTEGCRNKERLFPSIRQCMAEMGLFGFYLPEDIRKLEGEDKIEYCSKAKLAAKCAAEILSVCPMEVFKANHHLEQIESDQSTHREIPAELVAMTTVCDIDLLGYTDLLKTIPNVTATPSATPSATTSVNDIRSSFLLASGLLVTWFMAV